MDDAVGGVGASGVVEPERTADLAEAAQVDRSRPGVARALGLGGTDWAKPHDWLGRIILIGWVFIHSKP